MAEIAIDSLLKNLKQLLINCEGNLIGDEKDLLDSLYKDLEILIPVLKDAEEKCYEHDKVQDLVTHIRGVDSRVEALVVLGSRLPHSKKSRFFLFRVANKDSSMVEKIDHAKLADVMEEIKAIVAEVMEIYHKMHSIWDLQTENPSSQGPSRTNRNMVEETVMVGFDDEAMTVKEQLAGGKQQREVISIVGMPGLGKTTLARKVFNDPYIRHHFYIRAWTFVSQVYRKRQVLLDILHYVIGHTDKTKKMSDEMLGKELYQRLKGKRYLIVMDDVWSPEAWDDFKIYLPNDNNGSRVMFTSQLVEVALHAKPDSRPHCLRFLTEEESWELLREKVFQKEKCPPELMQIGKRITKECRGLPLAIVVIAGVLAKIDKTRYSWKQVGESVSSYIVSDPDQYMDTIALSYDHLPDHLKPCFLYFGAFLEDREILVQKLIWLWVAEGFIQQIGQKRLEDIAEDYLMDLIERSLVIVARKNSNGGIKTCRVHDLLRDFCLKKAEEVNFLYWIREYGGGCSSSSNRANHPGRLCIHPDFLDIDRISLEPHALFIRSFMCFSNLDHHKHKRIRMRYPSSSRGDEHISDKDLGMRQSSFFHGEKCYLFHGDLSLLRLLFSDPSLKLSLSRNRLSVGPWSFIYQTFKLLRVLDLWWPYAFFSHEILQLVHLRYLAILSDDAYMLPPSISNLSNLETLILGTQQSDIFIPHSVWKMVKLRHLYTKGGRYHIASRLFEEAGKMDDSPSVLDNLQTISNLCLSGPVKDVLAGTPNLRKLGFSGDLVPESGHLTFPDLEFLGHLETLKLHNTGLPIWSANLQHVKFPTNIRRLTLRGTMIEWEEISALGMLPNLEVLKLKYNACCGLHWETPDDGGFRRLKFLKFEDLNIVRWIASGTHFPSLQHIVLENCRDLEEIPLSLADILTLQMIEVTFCSRSVRNSASEIKKEQESMGNVLLKICVYP